MVLRKDELEVQLKDERRMIRAGLLREESPLDLSPPFEKLINASRTGDLKSCQEAISAGVNINARDAFDYTPLICASLCGHEHVVQLLLESGALCERDTFQGERCIYNALNNRIRSLLLQYDFSKSTDPLQPLASHINSLLTNQTAKTSDITLIAGSEHWNLHKFVLSARSPYFSKKLDATPEITLWKLAGTIPPEAFHIVVRYLYFGDIPSDLGISHNSLVTEDDVLVGIHKLSKQLEIEELWAGLLAGNNKRLLRQRHQDEVARGRAQMENWYQNNVLKNKIGVDTDKAQDVKWSTDNGIFADVFLRADEELSDEPSSGQETPKTGSTPGPLNGVPVGPLASELPLSPSPSESPRQSILYPVHKAMLLRSEYFKKMFQSPFREAQTTEHLQVISVDCSPEVLEVVLNLIYMEKTEMRIEVALDVLFTADMLFMDKLKNKAAQVISTLGMGNKRAERLHAEIGEEQEVDVEAINVYDVLRAGWFLKIQRLEEFSARYLAYRLEDYVDEQDFVELIRDSATRILQRQETDTIELLDDIRHYLSERFRLRFEDAGLEDMMGENGEINDYDTELSSNSLTNKGIRTLDGEIAEDEFAADEVNYQFLIGRLDAVLYKLELDA